MYPRHGNAAVNKTKFGSCGDYTECGEASDKHINR